MERAIRYIWAIALLGVLPMYFGCVQKSAQLQKGVAPPDRTLFETGDTYLKKGQYLRARMAFQTLLNTYPDSDMAPEAYFAMGDTFYEEGGTENLLQAENQYKDFIIFFQGDPRAADAQMKIISLNYKMMRTPDRDPQYARRTLQEIETLERRYPNSDYIPIARQLKVGVEDNLARGDLGVGEYSLRRGNLLGALQRLQYVVENYKNFEDMDTVVYRIAELFDRIQAPDAADWYAKLAEGYPFSRYYEDAKRRLTEMGFEIPEVNEALAKANQANIRPSEGFSPLKPLIDFGKALGFITPPDQYKEARKTVEEEKAQTAAKAAAGTGTGTDDDIQIESEIRRSASGEPVDETPASAAGSGESPGVSQDSDPASDDDANQPDGSGQQGKPSRYQRKPQQR
ncbi:MAG: outer membrane protein assembly factor BamD [Acidobacteria bacterium]|nr:outer membrane protein assembly factor BamD [Acidobacteriota bacterium]